MRLTVNKSGRKGVLRFKGELTLSRAAELKEALTGALNKVEHLALDLKNVNEVDISCFQLFCSAHRTAAVSDKKVIIADNVPDEIKNSIRYSGYLHPTGCINKGSIGCIWAEGAK